MADRDGAGFGDLGVSVAADVCHHGSVSNRTWRLNGEWLDLGFNVHSRFRPGFAEIELLLEADPEFGGGSEVAAESQGGVRRDGAATADDGGDTAVRDLQIHREAVLGDAQRFEKLRLRDLAGVGIAMRWG